ncbi:MAG TPA: DNA polymerase/3'-5' exonuclease PolX [Phycisphaerales bacterium]|nr:DNA polymerase/3'-5' exonuclease PolX [Phycisphaerales bacterium]
MKNQQIADLFSAMADLLEILGESLFRVNSYRKAARVLEELAEDIEAVAAADRLTEIEGIGDSTAGKIRQYLAEGRIEQYDKLKAQVPPDLPGLLDVPGLGPKTVAKLWKQASVTSVAELRAALDKSPERLLAVEGLGPKKLDQIRQSLAFQAEAGGRIRLNTARELAERLLADVRRAPGAQRATFAGSLRRGKETIGDIDLLCQADANRAAKIIQRFAASEGVERVLAAGATKGSVVLTGGVQADLRVVEPASYPAALMYFTGSKEHNIRLRELAVQKGWKLNEYGLFDGEKRFKAGEEADLYARLGLAYVPPELREDRGEVEAARDAALPELLEDGDLRGDLHMHTTASDGHNSIDEMIDACRAKGYKYLAICDHSKSQVQAHGLDEKRLAAHVEAIRKSARRHKDILVLTGVEVDIFKDGSLDFSDDVLAGLDFVTASAHSALAMSGPEATKRLIRAAEHPCVHCIGHPTGRMINSRPGMEIDVAELARAAAANGVALEINAHPVRLDLRDVHVRAAVEAGAKLVINTDAHSTDQLDLMGYGVTTARRGWARKGDVLNTLTPAQLRKWLGTKRK